MNAAATQTSRDASSTVRRDELILENLHLVQTIAGHVQRSLSVHTELDDLVHAGTMGLFEAATKYSVDKEVPFPVYAKHRIRGAILDSLRQIDWASRDIRKHYKHMQAVTRELSSKLHRTPTQAEVAEAMGLDEERWRNLMIEFRTLGLLASQQSTRDSDDQPCREIPTGVSDCPAHVFATVQLRSKLDSAMTCLPARHQQVVKMYYEADMTMKEIGSMLGVNESRVSQIHKSALAKMQVFLGSNGICSAAAVC